MSPYEIARIAEVLSMSTTDVIAKHTSEGGTVLRQREDGGCSLLDGKHCGVHRGRPLVCRLYPLGRIVGKDERETFVRLQGHPQSEGELGEAATIGDYLDSQGTEPYTVASTRYFALFSRLATLLRTQPDGLTTLESVRTGERQEVSALEWLDIDATLARRATSGIPANLEARVSLHLELLEREIAAMEAASLRHSSPLD